LQDCEGVFELAGITNEYNLKWAAAHIRGKAKTWLNNCNVHPSFMSWVQFCSLLLDRFPDSGIHESMEQFQQLKQNTTVNQYIDLFEEWMTAMKRDHQYLPEFFFTLRFLSGLKDTIKHAVQCHKPPDLRSAYWYARQEELAYLSVHKKQANTPIPAKQAQPQPARNTVFRENKFRPAADKTKEKGKCWYCPEDWSFGHKCSGIKSMVHAIEMQGHSDDELEIPPPQATLGPCRAQMAPTIFPVPEQAAQEAPGPADQLMLLSVEALHGIPGEGTLAIKITIENKQAVALIDSSSTNTFLDKSFANSHKLNLTPVS
jgi:hypothetical protein